MYADQQNSIKYSQLVNTLFTDQQGRKFHLTKLLGGGSEGGVFLADMTINNQKSSIALKIQNKMRDDEKLFIDKLIQYQSIHEIPNTKDFKPSYIIRIYERFVWNNADVIMMEKGEEDLFTYCKQNKKNLLDKSPICKNIMKSIDFLHSLKFFHRDIKPENFIRVGNDFKLCDFGLIKQFDQRLQTYNVGTAMFQAPEIIKDQNAEQETEEYNEKIDMWALGCLFYEILKEEEFFQAKTVQEIHQQIKSITANPQIMKDKISSLKISESWQNVLMGMLDPNAETRISSQEALQLMNKQNIIPQLKIQSQQQQQKSFPVMPNKGIQGQQQQQSIPQQNKIAAQTLQHNTGNRAAAQNVLQTDYQQYKGQVYVPEKQPQKASVQYPINSQFSSNQQCAQQNMKIQQENEGLKNMIEEKQSEKGEQKQQEIVEENQQKLDDGKRQEMVDENQQQIDKGNSSQIVQEHQQIKVVNQDENNEGKIDIRNLQKLSENYDWNLLEIKDPELYKEFVKIFNKVNDFYQTKNLY